MAYIRKIQFPHLLEELRKYCNKDFYWSSEKAKKIYALCIEQGHEGLAYRIFTKHSIHIPPEIQSDQVIAYAYALMASQIANK